METTELDAETNELGISCCGNSVDGHHSDSCSSTEEELRCMEEKLAKLSEGATTDDASSVSTSSSHSSQSNHNEQSFGGTNNDEAKADAKRCSFENHRFEPPIAFGETENESKQQSNPSSSSPFLLVNDETKACQYSHFRGSTSQRTGSNTFSPSKSVVKEAGHRVRSDGGLIERGGLNSHPKSYQNVSPSFCHSQAVTPSPKLASVESLSGDNPHEIPSNCPSNRVLQVISTRSDLNNNIPPYVPTWSVSSSTMPTKVDTCARSNCGNNIPSHVPTTSVSSPNFPSKGATRMRSNLNNNIPHVPTRSASSSNMPTKVDTFATTNLHNKVPSHAPTKSVAPPNISSKAMWNREKREHQKSQHMAFAKRADDPFSSFRFDPNAIESSIESLSTLTSARNPHQIIPPDTMHGLRSTRTRPEMSHSMPMVNRRYGCQGRRVRRKTQVYSSDAELDLLQMKADEAGISSTTEASHLLGVQNTMSPLDQSQFGRFGSNLNMSHGSTQSHDAAGLLERSGYWQNSSAIGDRYASIYPTYPMRNQGGTPNFTSIPYHEAILPNVTDSFTRPLVASSQIPRYDLSSWMSNTSVGCDGHQSALSNHTTNKIMQSNRAGWNMSMTPPLHPYENGRNNIHGHDPRLVVAKPYDSSIDDFYQPSVQQNIGIGEIRQQLRSQNDYPRFAAPDFDDGYVNELENFESYRQQPMADDDEAFDATFF